MRTARASGGSEVVWRPHAGTSQEIFLSCPVWEALYTGTRGPGKTDALLMDFAQDVGRGWGAAWRGILFREEATQLEDVRARCRKWFPRIFPGARYVGGRHDWWVWPDGEVLMFRHAKTTPDYDKYHGWEIPWLGWEELTNWPSLDVYHVMKSINRSTVPGMPRKVRATCNPYGAGHNQVKAYFIDPAPAGVPFVADQGIAGELAAALGVTVAPGKELRTVAIHGHYTENRTLMEAQPDYPMVIAAAATNPEQAKAWLNDDWDIVAGGMFDDVWRPSRHVLPPFASIPKGWTIDRAYDEGTTKPFSVGWWAEANGEEATLSRPHPIYGERFCPPPGSLIRIAEWYGWDGRTPNVGLRMTDTDVGKGIVKREKALKIHDRVRPGPADSNIFSAKPGQDSPAAAMAKEGAKFIPADKSGGSRVRGWKVCRRLLEEAGKDRPEDAGVWVVETCRDGFIRTVPTLPRSDADPEDVNTDAEDHVGDEWRYRALKTKRGVKVGALNL